VNHDLTIIEKFRINHPILGPGEGNNGFFMIPCVKTQRILAVQCSDGCGWDHVSVSLSSRCPVWDEMCFIKNLFFDAEETVMQLHPAKSQYKNCHPYCLHLWRPQKGNIPLPDSIFVAP